MAGLHTLKPEPVDHALRDLRARPVEAEERPACEVLVELRTAGNGAGADLVEDLHWQAAGIGRSFQHQRRDCGDQRCFGQAFRAVATDIAGNFATTRGEADQSRVFEIERFDESRQVIGVGIHVVAGPRLARAAMATTVMGDRAIAVGCQEEHLSLPTIGIQRPAVAEHDGVSCAPVLVIDLRAVFGCNPAHFVCLNFCRRRVVRLTISLTCRLAGTTGGTRPGRSRGDRPDAQPALYSVVLPSKCSLSASASARVWWTTPSR